MSSPSSRSTMFRQPAQRYQRAKGLKVKHVLQIAIVIVVLTWVAYELNQPRRPADSQGQDRSALRDTVQDPSLGRRALKPEGEPGKFYSETERETTAEADDTPTKTALEENVDVSRTEEDADDQRDRDINDLEIERAGDQDEKSEDDVQPNDVQRDVGTDFEELKNEQERMEQEEVGENGKNGDTEQEGDSQSLRSEVTTSSTEVGGSDGDSHQASVVDGDQKAGQTTFMDALNADSVLKHKLDKLDEGKVDDTSRAHVVDEKLDSATDALKEASEDSGQEVVEEKNADQNEEEMSQKEVDEEALDISDKAEDNVDSRSEVEDTANEQSDVSREKLSVESREEGTVEEKVETQEQKQAPVHEEAGEDEKREEKSDSLSHVQEQEQEEKNQREEQVEKKGDDPQIEVKDTESNIQPELKSEGAEADILEKNGNQLENQESLENVAGGLDSSTQGSEGENKRLVQLEGTEKSIQDSLGTSPEEKKDEASQNHGSEETQNGSESYQGNTEQKKYESAETSRVETDSESAEGLSDDSNSKVEKHSQEYDSAETVHTGASTQEDSKPEDEAPKDEVLEQVTHSNESDTKVEDQSAEKSNKSHQEIISTQQ